MKIATTLALLASGQSTAFLSPTTPLTSTITHHHRSSSSVVPSSLLFAQQNDESSPDTDNYLSVIDLTDEDEDDVPLSNDSKQQLQQLSDDTNEYSFFDEATIYIRAGSGGQGSSTYKKGVNNQNGPPDGGNGGKGGDVLLELDESLNTLAGLARYAWRPNSFGGGGGARRRGDGSDATSTRVLSFRAENGVDGARQNKQGMNGKDVIVRVPPGTVVQEEISSQNEDGAEPMYIDCGTITTANPTLKVAFGGEGGEGSSAEKLQRGVRRARTPPQGGERKRLKLTLKVVADVSIVCNFIYKYSFAYTLYTQINLT